MKSKYKLKIKEISMRLKSSLFLLLGVVCLLALGQMVQATTWTDPTCAAPNCNTDGPIWVNPSTAQTGFASLQYDDTLLSSAPIIKIDDQRVSVQPTASLYVTSAVEGAPAIQGSNTGDNTTSYGGYFSAVSAPGLYVSGGMTFAPLALDPAAYQAQGLLYYSSATGTYRYYDGSAWANLPLWSKSGNEIYYTFAAGTARGVAIKSGDLTGPNDNYTLDVLRVTQSTSDRAVYGRLTIDAGWDYYASGFMGGYDDSGNAVGVRGKVSDHMGGAQKNYGGYFEAAGGLTGTAGVYGLASTAGTASPTYGGYFQSNGVNGIGAYATGPNYGVEAVGTGAGIHAVGTTDGVFAEGDTAVYGYGQDYGGHFETDSSVTDGAIGVWAVSNSSTNGVGLYGEGNYAVHGNSGFSNGRGVYGQHQGAAVGYGVYGTSSGSSGYGVYGTATGTGAVTNYGGYFTSTGESGRAVYGNASTTNGLNTNYGGFFTSSGGNGIGVYASGGSSGAAIAADGVMRMKDITAPGFNVSGYGQVYVNSDKLYFRDDNANIYDLTAGGGSGDIEAGTAAGQMTFWETGTPTWAHTETSEMIWDDAYKNLGIGASPSLINRLHVQTNSTDVLASAVYGRATGATGWVFGGNFSIESNNGAGIRASGPTVLSDYAWAAQFENGALGIEEIGTLPGVAANYGLLYVKSSDSKIYFKDDSGNEYDLTGGVGAATGDNGTAAGQMNFWNGSKWTYTETSEMVWDDTNKNVGIGVASPTSTNKLHVVNSSAINSSTGVYANASAGTVNSYAVYGNANSGSGANYGGYFLATGTSGYGVFGKASDTGSAATYGGYFESNSTGGYGVRGVVDANTTGTGYGGYFTSNTYSGIGIKAIVPIGGAYTNYGGWFEASGDTGKGVYSAADGTTGRAVEGIASNSGAYVNYGGHFTAAGTGGAYGVYGNASGTTGVNYGGYFTTPSTTANAAAVYGNSTGASGQIYGGRFETTSTTGRGIYARATGTGATTNYGGYFVAAGDTSYAIYGLGANNTTAWAGYFDGRAGVGQSLYVGQASAADNDYLYFDAGNESIMWDNTNAEFTFSDDLNVTGGLTTSSTINGTNITASGYVMADNNLYIDYDISSATDTIYFSNAAASSDYFRYTSTTDVFSLTGGLLSTVVYGTTVGATNRDLYIDSTGLMGYVSSSLRYKDNVQDMEDISWLYNLRPVNFSYKNDEGKAKQYGLIAEEVEKVNPFFVSYDEAGLPETVSYSALVTPMLEAIQNQKQQLDTLETKVEMIEKDGCSNNEAMLMETIEKLEARIEALEGQSVEPVKTSFWSKLW